MCVVDKNGKQIKRREKLANVDGYIHAVSEVKNSPSWVHYFDFKIQERDEKR
jgi:hypothetical protein